MRRNILIPFALAGLCFPSGISAEQSAVAVKRDSHSTEWEYARAGVSPEGTPVLVTNRYTQLETGLNYVNERGEWEESRPVFAITETGAEVKTGQHKVSVTGNINSDAPVQLTTSDNKVLKSKVLGLAYYDPQTGESVMIAELKDSAGELHNGNVVIYPSAFTDLEADIRYTYTRAGFEQDVILRSQPPGAEAFAIDPARAQLEIWTEFIEPPVPAEDAALQAGDTNGVARTFVGPNLMDRDITFGNMSIGKGKAFSLGQSEPAVPVGKSWQTVDGARRFLVEAVNVHQIAPELEKLPAAPRPRAANKRLSPREYIAKEAGKRQPGKGGEIMLAKANGGRPGVVIDYVTVTSTSNMRLIAGETYYVTGLKTLSGITTIEGGAIVKYANFNNPQIKIWGTISCLASRYNPVIFTSRDDNTIGATIIDSTGQPSGYYATIALNIDNNNSDLRYIRLKHAQQGIVYGSASGYPHYLYHAQFADCSNGIVASSAVFHVRNALFTNVANIFSTPTTGIAGFGEHLTVHKAAKLNASTGLALNVQNSLLVEITTPGTYTGSNNQTLASSTGVFESAALGYYYLPAGSPYRNAGTTNISHPLQADLRTMTTEAPALLANQTLTESTVLSPRVQRDTDSYDIGYHYEALDYLINSVVVQHATLLLTNGVALGFFRTEESPDGFRLSHGAVFQSEGTPLRLNQMVHANAVQEAGNGRWGYSGSSIRVNVGVLNPLAQVTCKFTAFSRFWDDSLHYAAYEVFGPTTAIALFRDCQFNTGSIQLEGGNVSIENCLLNRTYLQLSVFSGNAYNCFQNTHFGGTLYVYQQSGNLTIRDSVFDGSSVTHNGYWIVSSHNGYSDNWVHFPGTSGSDVLVSTFSYETGTLGRFYQPPNSPLKNAASRTAAAAGLYHHTATVDQGKEGSSQADIGFHYMAVDPAEVEVSKAGMTASGSATGFGWEYSYAIDGLSADPGWHNTHWLEEPSFLRVDLGSSKSIRRVGYISRDGTHNDFNGGGSNGAYRQYEIYVTNDSSSTPANWGAPVASGWWHWPNGKARRDVEFSPTWGRYVYFRRITASGYGTPPGYANANEVWIYEHKSLQSANLDYDGDTLPDYLEDGNGNGSVDTGETGWQAYNSPNGLTGNPGIEVYTPVKNQN